ncbi:MAG: SDR family oxidoreductase [Ignavibacteria bacterium]|nr:SDR family oxidoreductase [Ignavibacteria bacterium]MBI3765210.1 SDR family oxidoreductase [Ignavibacteriales bacterium]
MNLGLQNKVALVCAASEGLGKATALALAREGARVIICSRRRSEIRKTANEITRGTGAEIIPVVADVSQLKSIRKLVSEAKRRFGTIHILVNNAGGPPTGDLLSMSEKEWKRGVELTLMSAVRLTREVLPLMIQQHWGRIITITSITAKQPINDLLISSTLRPGIQGLSKVLANKYSKAGVTINTVCPGFTLTNRQEELMRARSAKNKITMAKYMAETVKEIPIGRMARPEEIGNVIAFLCSEQASYINGVNLLVDGGLAKGIH